MWYAEYTNAEQVYTRDYELELNSRALEMEVNKPKKGLDISR